MWVSKPLGWRQCVAPPSVILALLLVDAIVLTAMHHVSDMFGLVVVFVVQRLVGLILRDQILPEFRASLVNGDCVAYHPSTTSGSVGELAALHPGILERRNAVHRIKEAEKADWFDGTAECFSECAHEF